MFPGECLLWSQTCCVQTSQADTEEGNELNAKIICFYKTLNRSKHPDYLVELVLIVIINKTQIIIIAPINSSTKCVALFTLEEQRPLPVPIQNRFPSKADPMTNKVNRKKINKQINLEAVGS